MTRGDSGKRRGLESLVLLIGFGNEGGRGVLEGGGIFMMVTGGRFLGC